MIAGGRKATIQRLRGRRLRLAGALRLRLVGALRRRLAGALRPWLAGALLLVGALLSLGCGERAAERPEDEGPPVAEPERRMHVVVHFTRDERPVPVAREVPEAPSELHAALDALLRGPTPEERAAGIFSFFSEETAGHLRSVEVDEEGRATVDFDDFSGIIPGASSAAGSAALLGELNGTVFANSDSRSVEYRFEGSCDAFWNWLQYECRVVEREAAAALGRP